MISKIHHRVRKLKTCWQQSGLRSNWSSNIEQCLTLAHGQLDDDWKTLAKNAIPTFSLGMLEKLEPEKSLDIGLAQLDTFLVEAGLRKCTNPGCDFTPTFNLQFFSKDEIPQNLDIAGESRKYYLIAIERWVKKELKHWIRHKKFETTTCERLQSLIAHYHAVATTVYEGLPISTSIMYLTLLELWVACDLSACSIHPLLKEYDPEVRLDDMQCLLLPKKSHMAKLHELERYVQTRRAAAAEKSRPSVFRHFGHRNSFAVSYFEQSNKLKELKASIEKAAALKHQKKCQELNEAHGEYLKLTKAYDNGTCEIDVAMAESGSEEPKTIHSSSCSRCAMQRKANNLHIDIFEMPLSSDTSIANATVFELQVPDSYGHWRDTTM